MPTASDQAKQALAISQGLLKSGQLNQALKTLNIAFLKQPADNDLSLELARLCLKINKPFDAVKVLEKSVKMGNQNADSLYLLASLLFSQDRLEPSHLVTSSLTRLHPDFHRAYNLLGMILLKKSLIDEAEKAYRKSISLAPDHYDSTNNLAWLLRATGRKKEAIESFEATIKGAPFPSEALFGLSFLAPDAKYFKEIDTLLSNKNLSDKQISELHFAKANIYDKQQKFSEAFKHYQLANQAWRRFRPYKADKDKSLFQTLHAIFSQENYAKLNEKNLESDEPCHAHKHGIATETPFTPIFIVGLPRSSTTLIEQILVSHSKVDTMGEVSYMPQLAFSLIDTLAKAKRHDSKEFVSLVQKIRQAYLDRVKSHRINSKYIIDKLPQNFLFVGLIKLCFPEAKIIHCYRAPQDNAISLYKHHFPMTHHDYAYDLTDIASYHQQYCKLMQHWKTITDRALYESNYEQLIADKEGGIRSLLAYCELDYEVECLNFHETERSIQTASSEQVRTPINNTSLDQWKNYESNLPKVISTLQSYS